MKNESVVAKRYARALYEAASEQNVQAGVEKALEAVARSVEASDELASFLSSRNVPPASKRELIGKLGVELPQLLDNTVRLLFDRNRYTILPELYKAYLAIANEREQKAVAYVEAPRELEPAEIESISQRFAAITGKQITVQTRVNEDLLGGLSVRIGDRLYDGSLRGKLNRLEKQLNPDQAM